MSEHEEGERLIVMSVDEYQAAITEAKLEAIEEYIKACRDLPTVLAKIYEDENTTPESRRNKFRVIDNTEHSAK